MGPITLFDKSFIQSISIDESVWFDHFFTTIVCPILYGEILADLEKAPRAGKSHEHTVRTITDKLPIMHSVGSKHHKDLCVSNMLGADITMTGQLQVEEGCFILYDGMPFPVYEISPTLESVARWEKGEFTLVEREYALQMRQQLSQANFQEYPDILNYWKGFSKKCIAREDARNLALEFIISKENPWLRMEILSHLLQIPLDVKNRINSRWVELHYPSIHDFAPYAAFQLEIFLFFFLCLRNNLVSKEDHNTLNDIAYLFYLPFCQVFVSWDNLHRSIVPLFLRKDQDFVYGSVLRDSLMEINSQYSSYPEKEKERGLSAIAPFPTQSLICKIWDHHLPSWRTKIGISTPKLDQNHFSQIALSIPYINRKRGSWYLFPKDTE